MEFIISHGNTDFDSLASMVAAKKLYPEAQMVFTGKLSREVKEYMALYKDLLNIKNASQVDVQKASKLIIVDTAVKSRIGNFAQALDKSELKIHIYDHHVGNEDLQGDIHLVKPLGATATMLVEMIEEKQINLNPTEATTIALGIYGDTGCLTYSTTTQRDVAAVAFLLGQKANLKVVREFIGRPLGGEQKDILNNLLNSMETYQIHGLKVVLAPTISDSYIDGLSALAAKVQDLESPDALFLIAQMGNRIHVVGRSKVREVKVNEILRPLGGGGHRKAASAAVKSKTLEEVRNYLYQTLQEKVKPLFLAKDIMSSPVKTIAPETSIREAASIMARYGHTGLPIVDAKGKLKGIISRRDLDKAKQHGYLHLPVKGFMSSKIVTITPETGFQDIQKIIIEKDIGRLPVLEGEIMVGIVSRTDVLRSFYAEQKEKQEESITHDNVAKAMEQRLPLEIQFLLTKIGKIADQEEQEVYVVGGFVRDLLLGKRNLDIDLVVEGDGMKFARQLAAEMKGELTVHPNFATANVLLPDGMKLDVATARREFYEYPAVLPTVETGSLKQDLYRRDFTINAMAVQLNATHYGRLIDFFGGQKDLQEKCIRVLYNLSFIEDPTRIFRALRFEQRYNFRLEEQTVSFINNALKMGVLSQLSGTRLKNELLLILKERNPVKILRRSEDWSLFEYIYPDLTLDKETLYLLGYAEMTINHFPYPLTEKDAILVYFSLLVHKLSREAIEDFAKKMEFTNKDITKIFASLDNCKRMELFLLEDNIKPSLLYEEMNSFALSTLYFFLIKTKEYKVKKRIVYFLQKLRNFRTEIDGKDLLQLGFKPGPLFKQVLDTIKRAKMDGEIDTKEKELNLAYTLLLKKEQGG